MKELKSIKYWIFDLDNTLYSGKTRVFEQVDKKMSEYISKKLNVSTAEAKEIQKNYFHEYNTTLNGMIKNHKIDADEFLEFVHNIDIDFLKKDPMLGEELKKLDGKYEFKIFNEGFVDEDDAGGQLKDYEALLIMRERTKITKSLINQLTKLKFIITCGMRNKAIDLETAKQRKIIVCGTEINSNPTAELTWALILGLARNLKEEIDEAFTNISELIKGTFTEVENNIPENVNINVVKAYLESILLNIFTNAIKYKAPKRYPKITINSDLLKKLNIINQNSQKLKILSDRGLSFMLKKFFNSSNIYYILKSR